MIGSEEQLLTEAVLDTFREASKAEHTLANVELGNTAENVESGPHADRLEEATEILEYHIEASFRHIAVLAERLGLPRYVDQIRRTRSRFPHLAATQHSPWDNHPVSPALAAAHELFRPLETMMSSGAGTALGVLERVLRSTPRIVARSNNTPTTEHRVVVPVLDHLRTCFTDAVGEGQILQSGRKVRCDIAIESLRAAIEFKFVDDKSKVRPVIDALIADTKNYAGDPRWRIFFAVVFQTGPFLGEAELQKEMRGHCDPSWRFIVVRPD